jgi:NAD(P)H-dependent FMN reductase
MVRSSVFAAMLLGSIVGSALLFLPPVALSPDLVLGPETVPAWVRPGTSMPAMRAHAERRPSTAGRAQVLPDGRLAVWFYRGAAVAGAKLTGEILRTDLLALWEVSKQDQRDRVKAAALELASEAISAFDEIVASPEFVESYRPQFNAALTAAANAGWQNPETQAALGQAAAISQLAILEFMVDEVRPVLLDQARSAIWQTLTSNMRSMFGLLSDGKLDLSPIEEALSKALADDKVAEGVRRAVSRIAGSPQVDAFGRAFARATARAINQDRRVHELVVDVMRDPAFRPALNRVGAAAAHLLDVGQSEITGLGEAKQLNPLAGAVFRSVLRGEAEPVLILLPSEAGTPSGKTPS